MATEDLAFVLNLYVVDRRGLFADASRTLFHAKSLVSKVASIQDDVLGYGDLVREQDQLKEKCKTLKRENSTTEKGLVELHIKSKLVDSL